MNMKKWMSIFVVAALAVGGFAAFNAIGKVSAQAGTATNSAVNQAAPMMAGGFERGGRGEMGYTDAELASALGITADELSAARGEAQTAALAQAVTDGLITQAQADEITANSNTFPFGGCWGGWLGAKGIDFDAYLADALGISADELSTARATAMDAHLATLVADGSITQDQADLMKARQALAASDAFQGDLQSAYESALANAVSAGTITQSQADLLLAERIANGGFGMRMGGFGGMGGGGRHGR